MISKKNISNKQISVKKIKLCTIRSDTFNGISINKRNLNQITPSLRMNIKDKKRKIYYHQPIFYSPRDILNWLTSVNVDIKKKSQNEFFINHKIFDFNSLLLYANKKRVAMGMSPFRVYEILHNNNKKQN